MNAPPVWRASLSRVVALFILVSLPALVGCERRARPSPAAERYESGVRLAKEGEITRAMSEWQVAIGLDPSDPRPYLALAQQWEQAGRLDQATAILERLETARPETPHLQCRLAQLLFVQGRHEPALERAEKAAKSEPECAVARAVYGMALEEVGETAAAIAELEAARRLDPKDERIPLTLAQVLARAGRLEEAERLADQVQTANPVSAAAHYLRGWLAARRGKPSREAEVALRRALELDPEQFRAHATLGGLLARRGRFHEAKTHLERARPYLGDDPDLLGDLARAYRGLGDPRAAALEREAAEATRLKARYQTLRRRLRAHPDDAAAGLELARLEQRRGDVAAALERVRAVLRNDPNNAEALQLMHRLLRGQ